MNRPASRSNFTTRYSQPSAYADAIYSFLEAHYEDYVLCAIPCALHMHLEKDGLLVAVRKDRVNFMKRGVVVP